VLFTLDKANMVAIPQSADFKDEDQALLKQMSESEFFTDHFDTIS
jgi:hypothetical protein